MGRGNEINGVFVGSPVHFFTGCIKACQEKDTFSPRVSLSCRQIQQILFVNPPVAGRSHCFKVFELHFCDSHANTQKMAILYTQISPLPYLWIHKGEFYLPHLTGHIGGNFWAGRGCHVKSKEGSRMGGGTRDERKQLIKKLKHSTTTGKYLIIRKQASSTGGDSSYHGTNRKSSRPIYCSPEQWLVHAV